MVLAGSALPALADAAAVCAYRPALLASVDMLLAEPVEKPNFWRDQHGDDAAYLAIRHRGMDAAAAEELLTALEARTPPPQRIRELAAGNPMLEAATEPMLRARGALRQGLAGLERHVRQLAHEDPVCRRLMSMPEIGAVVSLTYRSAVDDPARFTSSKKVGSWVGLTPSRNQSGERDISGGIYQGRRRQPASSLVPGGNCHDASGRATWLRTWAPKLARRRGAKRAMVALARRIAVILHRMWKDDTDFRFEICGLHAG